MRAKAMALAAENEARAEAIAAPLPFQPAALREPVSPETLPAALLENSPSAAVALAPATDPAPGAVADRPPAAAAAQLTLVADALDQAVKTLTDTVTIFASSSMPQERALAADALALLLPHLHDLAVEQVARRVSAMAAPPAGLLSLLLEHPNPRAAELVVERSPAVSEHDLTRLIDRGSETAMLAMARRRQVSELVAEQLAKTRSGPVLLALARNSGASLSPHTFEILCDMAAEFPALQAPLATRPNLPPAQAFELFWHSPPDLRRHLLTRFLVDTEAVGKIVRSIEAVGLLNRGAAEAGEVDTFVELLAAGQITFAVQSLSSLLAIDPGTAERIVTDRSGEALAAALKALGMTRADASKTIELLVKAEHAPITSDRNTQELHYVFDSLSMNKARVLLTYWDWSVRRRKGH